MKPFKVAACALCAKADIPEVEAVIRLLHEALNRPLDQLAEEVYQELLDRLEGYAAVLGMPDVDVLVQAGDRRDEVLAAILASLVLVVERHYSTVLVGDDRRQIEDAIDALLAFGARDAGFVLDPAQADLLRQAAIEQLDSLLREAVIGQTADLRRALEGYLTTASTRAAGAGALLAPAGAAPTGLDAFRAEILSVLAPAAAWAAAVDSWAYLWQNVGAFEAAYSGGVRAFEARAVGGRTGDGRTTAFCRWVHGRIIPIARVQAQRAAMVQASLAGDAEAIQRAWPFLDGEVARNGHELQFERFFRGAGLPPYHFRCRTTVRPVRIELR